MRNRISFTRRLRPSRAHNSRRHSGVNVARYLDIVARAQLPRSGSEWRVCVVINGRSGPERQLQSERAAVRFEADVGHMVRVDMRDVDAAGRALVTYSRSLILGDSLPPNTIADAIWLEPAGA